MPLLPILMGLAQLAPLLLKWVGGSDTSVAVAQKAVDVAVAITGETTPENALAKLQADPALALKYQEHINDLEFTFEKLYVEDREDARKRDTAFIQAGRYNVRADVLAFLAVGGLVLCVYFIARDANLPERAVNAIMFIAGVLASAVKDVYGFEFGSSKGSKEANGTIAELLKRSK